MRQDAVMQQVFGMVNQLLKENSETKRRDLRIKTYKVLFQKKLSHVHGSIWLSFFKGELQSQNCFFTDERVCLEMKITIKIFEKFCLVMELLVF